MAGELRLAGAVLLAAAMAGPAYGQTDAHELAKKVANPISDLVVLPVQMNWDSGIGPVDQTRFIMNVQPVMPFALNQRWNLVPRIIVPFVSQPQMATGAPADFGIGDVLASVFVGNREQPLLWGVGPALSLPSTSQPTIGSGKWSAGPTFVIVNQRSGWTSGVLWHELWSFSGNTTRADVSEFYLQPFLAYTTQNAWTLTLSSESTANWNAGAESRWTVPVILTIAKLSTFGTFPASYQFGGGAYVVTPAGGPSWRARFTMSILLPRAKAP